MSRNKRKVTSHSQTDCTAPFSLIKPPNTRQNTTSTDSPTPRHSTRATTRDVTRDNTTITEIEDLELANIAVSISPDTFSPPGCTSPRRASPRRSSPKCTSPKCTSPRGSSPRRSSPRRSSPRVSPRRSCSPLKSPQTISPAAQSNLTTLSPINVGDTKTRNSPDGSDHDDSGRDLFLTPRGDIESN